MSSSGNGLKLSIDLVPLYIRFVRPKRPEPVLALVAIEIVNGCIVENCGGVEGEQSVGTSSAQIGDSLRVGFRAAPNCHQTEDRAEVTRLLISPADQQIIVLAAGE